MPVAGEAGPSGDKIRSDCHVAVKIKESGGLKIELESKVEVLYGSSIKTLVREVAEELGVRNAEITIVDRGALPFVIAARIETAVKRADPSVTKEYLPEMREFCRYPTEKERFRRSRLYVPGNQPKLMLNAGLYGADGVILDLEDSVPPYEKDAARFLVRNALRVLDFRGAERMVRINQLPAGLDDLDYIVPHNVHMVLIPKCETAEDVRAVDGRVREILSRCGMEDREIFLMPIIESAKGVINAYEIASATDSVAAISMGLEDYTADIGVQRTEKGMESFFARGMVVNAAKAAGVQPIDTVYSDINNMAGLRESVLEAKSLGFEGKGCIHPRQIPVVNSAFAPTEEEIEKARKIVLAYEEAERSGLGVVSLGSKMIDPPVVKRAIRTMELAVASGVLPENWRDDQ